MRDGERRQAYEFGGMSINHIFQGSSSVLAFFNNSVTRALLATYPDIGIDKDRFHNLRK